MGQATTIKALFRGSDAFLNKEITIEGWVRTIRASKNFGFIELNDGSFFNNVQVVFGDHLANFAEISKYGINTALSVAGTLVATPEAKQPFELHASQVTLVGNCPGEYPLQKKRHTFEYLRTIAHLRPRTNTFAAVFRLRSGISYAIHRYFFERGFVYAHTPIITTSDAEGAGDMFTVSTLDWQNPPKDEAGGVDFSEDFFGKMAHLTVSGQLNAEAFAMAYKNTYTFGPTFRAENSNTARHAAEFWMLEPEIAFADLADDMDLAEDMLKYLIRFALMEYPEEMAFFNAFVDKELLARLERLQNAAFVRITYTEAIAILDKADAAFAYPVSWGIDLQTEHERYLTDVHFRGPVFVTDYPKEIKAFYMRLNDDGQTVAAVDLLVPGIGELIGGSQREERYDVLVGRLAEMGLDQADYDWYLDLRRFGGTKHAGFGLGFERLIMYLTGLSNIRDVIAFPRTPGNADF